MPNDASRPPHRGVIALLAGAAGLTVANIYYHQALLPGMAAGFHATAGAVSAVAVATQLGYATGLLLLVPLGDRHDRRALIVLSAVVTSAMLVLLALAPTLPLAVAASYGLGLVSVTPQLIVPFGAGLAEPQKRGRVVGLIMSGLLLGILFARSAAGFLAAGLGWRSVFLAAAGTNLLIAGALRFLPRGPHTPAALTYPQLLFSLWTVWRREPVLRRHALIGALGFGAFSAFWTTVAFYLEARPEHFGSAAVGMLALVALAGAAVAPLSGHLSERHSARRVNGAALGVMVLSFLLMAASDRSLLWLVLAVFLMDAGVQGSQISNQTRIYALAPELRNRLTSVYMVLYFLGGAMGSALGARAWAAWHWTGVWATGAALSLLALAPLWVPGQAVSVPPGQETE